MPSWQQKATGADAIARGSVPPRVVWDPGMHIRLLHGNRESSVTACDAVRGAATGRPEVIAEDERDGAVRLTDSVCLTADVSGGLKSHSARGPGLISKGGVELTRFGGRFVT